LIFTYASLGLLAQSPGNTEHTTIITNPQSNAKTTLKDVSGWLSEARAAAGIPARKPT
jgi:hypothetical protein